MAAQIEVYPDSSGGWRWRRHTEDSAGKASEQFDTRSEAFEDALLEREDERVVLLREDGSEHSELYHARHEGGPPQRVDLLAASSREEAVSVDG